MVAAAGAGVAAVEHELLGAQARLRGLPRRASSVWSTQLGPAARRLDVDLDHAGIGRDLDVRQPRIVRRRVALEDDRQVQRRRRLLDRGDEIEVVLRRLHRRHEDVQAAVARLDAQRGAHDPGGRFAELRHHVVLAIVRLQRLRDAGGRRRAARRDGRSAPARSRDRRAAAAAGGPRIHPARSASRARPRRPTAGCRAAGGSPSASRPGAGTGARARKNHGPLRQRGVGRRIVAPRRSGSA